MASELVKVAPMTQTIQRRRSGVHPPSHKSAIPSVVAIIARHVQDARKTDYFDKVAIRLRQDLTTKQMAFLAKHAESVDQRPGRYIRKLPTLLTIVRPDRAALEFLATVKVALVNYVEVSRDIATGNTITDMALADFAFAHFVQPYHSRRETVYVAGTTAYTGQNRPGHRFVWYGDGGKPKGRGRCRTKRAFHMECRAHGSIAVRKVLKVNHPRDLVGFDHDKFWQPHLNYFTVDLDRLGRYHENKRTGQRRKSSKPSQDRWPLTYRRIGGLLFRLHSGPYRSVQQFIDSYGKGPYVVRLAAIPLISTKSHQVTSNVPFASSDVDPRISPKGSQDHAVAQA